MQHRIFHQISKNLVQRKAFELNYGSLLDKMFSYSSNNLQEELTEALNYIISEEGNEKLKPDDLEGFVKLHTKSNLQSFEELFGLRSILFSIQVPKENWGKIRKMVDLDNWAGGAYYSKEFFSNFNHDYLNFKNFGMGIENPEVHSSYNHEALHAVRSIYSKNYDILNNWYDEKYEREELQMGIEYSMIDELLCKMATNERKKEVVKDLQDLCLPSIRKEVYDANNYTSQEKKKIWRWSKNIGNRIRKVVETSYWLNIHFNQTILVPLFLSFGPTISEICDKIFYSPFTDIINLGRDLDDGKIKADEISDKIIEKGYSH